MDQLPYSVTKTPNVFTKFRVSVEPIRSSISLPLTMPPVLKPFPSEEIGESLPNSLPLNVSISTLSPYLSPAQIHSNSVIPFQGGETSALKRLKSYFWDSQSLSSYKETRNGLLGENYSSKFSIFLALGCLSPRQIHQELLSYESQIGGNSSTYWLYFELLWRDYFAFTSLKFGNDLFALNGMLGDSYSSQRQWKTDSVRFQKWKNGTTGIPFVDANMRELSETG